MQIEKLAGTEVAKHIGNVEELLSISPELNRYPKEQWETLFYSLKRLGFNSRKFAHMISKHPKMLIKSPEKIDEGTNKWRSFNFGEKNTLELLERYPELLDLTNFRLVHDNLSVINSFVGQKNGHKVLRNSPNVATEQTRSIEEKIDYLKDEMKVDPVEVYKSDVFSHDLLKIKTRHAFLYRLGMYFKKKKKGDTDNDPHEINKNPKLSKIMDTSDKRFALKVCHVSLEEYETFQDMFKEEIEGRKSNWRPIENDEDED